MCVFVYIVEYIYSTLKYDASYTVFAVSTLLH